MIFFYSFTKVWPLFQCCCFVVVVVVFIKWCWYAHILHQRVEINRNHPFVFEITSISVSTGFPTVISTRSWWRRTLNYIPNLVKRNTTHIPNSMKIGLKLWPSQCSRFIIKDGGLIMLMRRNSNEHNLTFRVPFVESFIEIKEAVLVF